MCVCMLLMYTEIFFLSLAVLLIITHAGIAAGVGKAFSLVCLSVCLFVCPQLELSTPSWYNSRSAFIDP